MRVLLFGGTTEGRDLTDLLANAGVPVCVSVATERGLHDFATENPLVSLRAGALSQEEKVQLMAEFDLVADATHPYAQSISGHVREAATQAGVPYVRVVRPQGDTEGCLVAETVEEAVRLVPAEGMVLSTIGAKEVCAFEQMLDYRQRLVARVLDDEASVERCRAMGLPDERILAGRGPFSYEDNVQVLREFSIATLVTKESGTAGGYPEKLAAARDCGATVVVVARPPESDGLGVEQAFSEILSHNAKGGV